MSRLVLVDRTTKLPVGFGSGSASDIVNWSDTEKNLQASLGTSKTHIEDGASRPLGTAEWSDGHRNVKPFAIGDFYIGENGKGEKLGVGDDTHVFINATNRGGKGVSNLIPNLIFWPGSAVVLDPKGENAMVTARRRGHGSSYSEGMGQKVRILDPFDVVRNQVDEFADLKCGFNPMAALKPDREESIDIAHRIADSIVVAENVSDPIWPEAARDVLLKPLMLHVASSPEFKKDERNLVTVRRLIVAGAEKTHRLAMLNAKPGDGVPSPYSFLAKEMLRNPAFDGLVARGGTALLNLDKSPRTLASVVQVASTNTAFIDSPGVQRCLARHDFELSELKTDPRGVTVYLCLPQRFVETHFRWMRMMTTLIIGEMEAVKQQPACGHRVMMMLDEFPALRRLRVLENAAAQIAGFGVKLVMVAQTLAQIKDLYKDNWETLLANAGTKLFFCNDDHFTREYVSKLIGEAEVVRKARSNSESVSQSESTTVTSGTGHSFGSTSGSSHSASHNLGQSGGSSSVNSSMGLSVGHSTSEGTSEAIGTSQSSTSGFSETVQKRLLLNPDEVGREFGDRRNPVALALISGCQPMRIHRKAYFQGLGFAGFYDPHSDHPLPLTANEAGRQRSVERRKREADVKRAQAMRLAAEARRVKAGQDAAWARLVRETELEERRRIANLKHQREREEWSRRSNERAIFNICCVVGAMFFAAAFVSSRFW